MKGMTGENLMIMLEAELTVSSSEWDLQEQERSKTDR